jgi:uncharacterized protein (UPF0248 family)
MQPLDELLHRIRWDAEFGTGQFALGYYDRVEHEEKIVALDATMVDRQSRTFSFADEEGVGHRIPLHRVRSVYKNGVVVWHRPENPLESRPRTRRRHPP